jgi:Skp family chaperone for outer membrane proteins
MSDHSETPWRGRLRLSSNQQSAVGGGAPLSEAERDAVDGWLPKGTRILAHTRGRPSGTDRPLWLVTSDGVLIASLSEEADRHLRARVNWVPLAQLRRVDLITNSTLALVRLLTPTRRFVLFGSDEDSATRFTVFARSLITADREGRQRPRGLRRAPLLTMAVLGMLLLTPGTTTAQANANASASSASRPLRIAVFNSRLVFESMPERAAAESTFALEQAKARTMLNAASDSLRAAVDEFTRAEQQLSPRQREAASMQLRARELMVEEMVANLDAIILQRNEEIQAPMRARLREAVRDLRVSGGYDLLIDLADESRFIEADARIDVTSALVKAVRGAPTARRELPLRR